ncbi:MAG: response regulator [Desulfobacteraceae bacterium]|jgi:two-component system chemotaxis response regulator CheY
MAYNILIVDDSSPMRSVIKKTIKASGFKSGIFHDASDGRMALEVLKENWIDLVLTDYNMPNMDGLQLIGEIKDDETLKDIPVVFVTTEGSTTRVKEFLEKGAAGYIQKPFTPEEIRQKLNNFLGEEDGQEFSNDSNEELDF